MLKDEKQINPFLRCHTAAVTASAQAYANRSLANVQEVFAVIREWKNNFRA